MNPPRKADVGLAGPEWPLWRKTVIATGLIKAMIIPRIGVTMLLLATKLVLES